MTEPRDDEAGREGDFGRIRARIDNAFFGLDMAHGSGTHDDFLRALGDAQGEVLSALRAAFQGCLAPHAATAPSEPREGELRGTVGKASAAGAIAGQHDPSRADSAGESLGASTGSWPGNSIPHAPRDEAAALLREAAVELDDLADSLEHDAIPQVGDYFTEKYGLKQQVADARAMRQRIDAYLRRAGPEGGERSA
jgi:hypothetical protein